MSLSDGCRESLTEHYNDLADELYILYRSLVKSGFKKDQAFDIVLNVYLSPRPMSKREVMEKNQRIIKERLERIKAHNSTKEKKNHD